MSPYLYTVLWWTFLLWAHTGNLFLLPRLEEQEEASLGDTLPWLSRKTQHSLSSHSPAFPSRCSYLDRKIYGFPKVQFLEVEDSINYRKALYGIRFIITLFVCWVCTLDMNNEWLKAKETFDIGFSLNWNLNFFQERWIGICLHFSYCSRVLSGSKCLFHGLEYLQRQTMLFRTAQVSPQKQEPLV